MQKDVILLHMTEDELVFVPLNKENVKIAGKIQYDIFHEVGLCGYCDYLDEVNNKANVSHSFLAYLGGKPVGISGLHEVDKNSNEIWVNWLGVVEDFRRRGIGSKIFEFILQKAKEMGKSTLRLYTFPLETGGGRKQFRFTKNLLKFKRFTPIF